MAIYQKMKIDPNFQKLPFKNLFTFSFVLNIAVIALGFLAKFILPPEIPLFYGLPQTESQLAPAILIGLPAFVALILTALNALISINLESVYLKRTLAFTSISVSILAFIATYKIVFLVGSL